jgi:hypothetical protein
MILELVGLSVSCQNARQSIFIASNRPQRACAGSVGQGLMVGSLVVMVAVTLANMKKHVLLHKLIFAEVYLPAMKHRPSGY